MRIFVVLISSLFITACVNTSEVQLDKATWQIQADGRGLLARGKTINALSKRAAKLTIEQGYTHFILGVPQTGRFVSTGGFTPIRANVLNDSVLVTGGQPINIYNENSVALVHMSRSSAGGALDASDILASPK